MIIRYAYFADLQYLMPLAHEAHGKSVYADIEMNEAIVQRNFVTAMEFDDGYAKVVVKDGDVVGGLVGLVIENHFGIRCSTDLFCYSRAGTGKLIDDFAQWSFVRGARFVQVTDLTGNKRYQNVIRDVGFSPSGQNFTKVA